MVARDPTPVGTGRVCLDPGPDTVRGPDGAARSPGSSEAAPGADTHGRGDRDLSGPDGCPSGGVAPGEAGVDDGVGDGPGRDRLFG